jgi:hypothetical protein
MQHDSRCETMAAGNLYKIFQKWDQAHMGWMEELLGTVPAAAKYRAELETLARENARLHVKTPS